MPSTSSAQHHAMEAAAHGKSTLGIPKKVGAEFANADAAKARGPNMSKPKYQASVGQTKQKLVSALKSKR